MSQLKEIVNDALELGAAVRDAFVAQACGDDQALRDEVQEMLALHSGIGEFLDPPGVSRGVWARALGQGAAVALRPMLVGAVLDDRYQLEERLGTGSSGSVYDATDLLTGERVAVKVLTAIGTDDLGWFRRELSALRLLELPGVVRLLDDGVHDGIPFLVMPKVEGTPFPGRRTPVAWPEIAETAIALLETLARIHARGVVHGDLKPANVLVEPGGRPIVLDLGVSSGPSVPGRLEGITGTPAYLSPEQFDGQGATPGSDLYAFGVMLHEALTGTNPHPIHSLEALVTARLGGPASSLVDKGVDLSSRLGEVIDGLLLRDPAARTSSAAQVVAILRGELPPLEALRTHPALQLDETVAALVEAAECSSRVALYGPPRSGRSICLRRAAGALRRSGRSVLWLDRRSLASARSPCDVVIMDSNEDGPDTLAGAGCVIRLAARPEEATICIQPLSEEALRELFCGSDRIFHLREDAARELHCRTQGWPVRVADELSAWVRAGLARGVRRAIEVERGALDLLVGGFRVCPLAAEPDDSDPLLGVLAAVGGGLTEDALAAGMRMEPAGVAASLAQFVREGRVDRSADGVYRTAFDSVRPPGPAEHAAAVRALPPGAPDRLRHVAVADAAGIASEARDAALGLMRLGSVGRAHALITEGLASVRGHGCGDADELLLLGTLVVVAGAEGTERSFDLALYEMGRSTVHSRQVVRLEKLARVAMLALRRDGDRALALARALGPFEDPGLEQLRQSARAMAARSGQRDRSEEVLHDVERWAHDNDAPLIRSKLKEWQAWASYMHCDFDEAVSRHREALQLAPDPRSRLSALLNVAETALEAGRYDETRALAREALATAARQRHPFYEARAEAVLRFAAYRSGEATAVDEELVEAIGRLSLSNFEAQVYLNEGAVAWRCGDTAAARRLVYEAHCRWRDVGHLWGALLTRAFLAALGEESSPATLAKLQEQARECPLPGIALQTLALLALRTPERAPGWAAAADRLAAQIAPRYRHLRREVASVEECLDWIKNGRSD